MAVLGINHIAFRTPDPEGLHAFYARLHDAEALAGEHHALRAGDVVLVFFMSTAAEARSDPDELAFGVDRAEFDRALDRARKLDAVAREPVEHTPWSRGFLVTDPDGRRIEIIHDDHSVFWRES